MTRRIVCLLRDTLWRHVFQIGLVSWCFFLLSMTAYAQLPDPAAVAGSVVSIADKNALLACVYISALVAVLAVVFAWCVFRSAQLQQKQDMEVARELAIALTSLATQLNTRPCIMTAPQPANPYALKGAP